MLTNNKIVFIGGLHRSGTWLQTHCLEDNPNISRLGTFYNGSDSSQFTKYEGQFLQSVYPDDQYYGGVGRFGFHPEIHLTEESGLLTNENKEKIFSEWSKHWDLSKPFLLEKTPANITRSRFLQAIFPDACFIFIMRHPVPVAFAQQKWTGLSLTTLVEHWLICYEMLFQDLRYINNYVISRYEDFIKDPESNIRNTQEFIGIEYKEHAQEINKNGNNRYFSIWKDILFNKKNEKAFSHRIIKRIMPYTSQYGYAVNILSNEVDLIAQRYEARLNQFGYSFNNLDDINPIKL